MKKRGILSSRRLALSVAGAALLLLMGCLVVFTSRKISKAKAPFQSAAAAPAVPPSAAVGEGYFNDALFIGDSRTKGFMLYGGLSSAVFYTETGLTVRSALTDCFADGKTLEEALNGRVFGKIYIMLGLNELGWQYPEVYRDAYRQLIETVQNTQPHALVYLQAILPVSAKKEAEGGPFTLTRIAQYNEIIEELASQYGCIYLTPGDAVCDEAGYLPSEAASDGVHLTKSYCLKWADYLKTHTLRL